VVDFILGGDRSTSSGAESKSLTAGFLRIAAATPLGPWLLFAIAVGLAIFGLYSWCEARWRAVEPG
jgi:Domain of Unknown Function (DUF1206)